MDFFGTPYPIVNHPKGLLHVQNGPNLIKASLLQILLTNPGERVMLPTFGTPFNDLIFEFNDSSIINKVVAMISNSIATWEPRVVIQKIEVNNNFPTELLNPNDPHINIGNVLGINIFFFDPESISEVQNLILEVPLSGNGTTINTNLNTGAINNA